MSVTSAEGNDVYGSSNSEDDENEEMSVADTELGTCKLYLLDALIIVGMILMGISFVLFIVGVLYRGTSVHDPLVISAIVTILIGAFISFLSRFLLVCINNRCCCFSRRCCCFRCCKCCFKKETQTIDERNEEETLIKV